MGSISKTSSKINNQILLNQPSVDEFAQIEVGQRNREAGTLGQNDDWGDENHVYSKNIEEEDPKIPEAQPMGAPNFS